MQFLVLSETTRVAIVLLSLLFFSILAYNKKSLDKEGVLIANIVGLLAYIFGGLSAYLVIVILFIVAELSTRFGRKDKRLQYEKRTISNIVGNTSAAIISLVLGSRIAFFGAVSAALADTTSSEIGVTSKKKPVLITNWSKKVEPGTDGGVSARGTMAAIAGAGIMAAIYFYFSGSIAQSAIVLCAGVLGQFADSFFGAMFERRRRMNNSQVNFLGTASGAVIAFGASALLGML